MCDTSKRYIGSLLSYHIPVCIFKCWLREFLCAKPRSQCSHLKGLIPVWMFEWCLRYSLEEKLFPQASHMKGFSPNNG